MNKRQCSFQGGVIQTGNLKVVLTIENPEKWLSTKEKSNCIYLSKCPTLTTEHCIPNERKLTTLFLGDKTNYYG